MSIMSWFSPKANKIEKEKKELKVELAHAIVKFERRRTEVERVSTDVLELMHRRRSTDK